MGAKALINAHPKNVLGSKGARRCRVCGTNHYFVLYCYGVIRNYITWRKNFNWSSSLYCNSPANPSAIIRKYHLDMCRQCFRERALDIGFVKVHLFITRFSWCCCNLLVIRSRMKANWFLSLLICNSQYN